MGEQFNVDLPPVFRFREGSQEEREKQVEEYLHQLSRSVDEMMKRLFLRMSNSYGTKITDEDGDTKVDTEESEDEDVIRFGIGGVDSGFMSKDNIGIGRLALQGASPGNENIGIGGYALYDDDFTGNENVAIGWSCMIKLTSGENNVGVGDANSITATTGSNNTALGSSAGREYTTGSNNVFVGNDAGRYHANGSTSLATPEDSVYIGAGARGKDNDDDNSVVIGAGAIGAGADTVVLGNTDITDTYIRGYTHLDSDTEDTPTTDPGWASSSTVNMNAPDGYLRAYVGAQAVVIPYWNT